MKKLVGSFLIASILTTGLVTTPSLTSASTGLSKTEEVTQSYVASKFVQIPYDSVKKREYFYDDGMYRGWLKVTGWVFDHNDNMLPAWLGGTVYCYSNCAIPNVIKDEIK